jgi:hypothetical protein
VTACQEQGRGNGAQSDTGKRLKQRFFLRVLGSLSEWPDIPNLFKNLVAGGAQRPKLAVAAFYFEHEATRSIAVQVDATITASAGRTPTPGLRGPHAANPRTES